MFLFNHSILINIVKFQDTIFNVDKEFEPCTPSSLG
jgi:hypothetical protein